MRLPLLVPLGSAGPQRVLSPATLPGSGCGNVTNLAQSRRRYWDWHVTFGALSAQRPALKSAVPDWRNVSYFNHTCLLVHADHPIQKYEVNLLTYSLRSYGRRSGRDQEVPIPQRIAPFVK